MPSLPTQASSAPGGGTTRDRVVESGPVGELLRRRPPPQAAALRPPAAGQPRPALRRSVRQAHTAAEVSWAVAAILRRALGSGADAWVSTTLRVVDSGRQWRPDVAVSPDPLPVDGCAVPRLVVEVDAQHLVRPAAEWLACGVSEIWILSRGEVSVVTGSARTATRRSVVAGALRMPLGGAVVDAARLHTVTR